MNIEYILLAGICAPLLLLLLTPFVHFGHLVILKVNKLVTMNKTLTFLAFIVVLFETQTVHLVNK
jgi:hypothetical protein